MIHTLDWRSCELLKDPLKSHEHEKHIPENNLHHLVVIWTIHGHLLLWTQHLHPLFLCPNKLASPAAFAAVLLPLCLGLKAAERVAVFGVYLTSLRPLHRGRSLLHASGYMFSVRCRRYRSELANSEFPQLGDEPPLLGSSLVFQ